MLRSTSALVLLVAALAACGTGCTTCASPQDYCGPVYNGGCEPCIIDQRVGSILDDPGVGPVPNTSPLVPGRQGPAGAGGTVVPPATHPLPEYDGNFPDPPEPSTDNVPSPPSARFTPSLRR